MPGPDLERFRVRRFAETLADRGEVEIHSGPVALIELAGLIESTEKATWFKDVGPDHLEMVAGLAGSRRRLALAFDADERGARAEFARRLQNPQEVVTVPSKDAPVHQVVLTGAELDLGKLPFYLQHEFDGATYISSAMDFTVDPATGRPNVGCRRLMLKSRNTMRTNLTQPSDLKRVYLECVARKERLNLSFVIGGHPCDFVAAASRVPMDEFRLIATLRGATLGMVKGVTNGVPVPADAEIVVEGYLDERGHAETEGPYGELYGLYGPMHPDPVFHATAITMRKDAIHHTLLHGGRYLERNDASHLSGLTMEAMAWRVLKEAGIDVRDIYSPPAATGIHHLRVAIHQKKAADGRAAIDTLIKLLLAKHFFVVDEDVDVYSDNAMEWAFCTRFRADRDIVHGIGDVALSMDPTIADGKMIKAGFDLTRDIAAPDIIENWRSDAPIPKETKRYSTIQDALAAGPKFFIEIMQALGSRDGRELSQALGKLQDDGIVTRGPNSVWMLVGSRDS